MIVARRFCERTGRRALGRNPWTGSWCWPGGGNRYHSGRSNPTRRAEDTTMGRWSYCGVVLLCVAGLPAQLPPPRVVPTRDVWEIAQIENARAGYYRTAIQDIQRDGQKVQKATQEL